MISVSRILYYPTYTPSRKQLRSLLMFYDNVTTIVPNVDQYNVTARDHVEEINNLENGAIGFVDPGYKYSQWINRDGVQQLLEYVVSDVCNRSVEISTIVPTISIDGEGIALAGQNEKFDPLLLICVLD